MEGSLYKELYSESLDLSSLELGPQLATDLPQGSVNGDLVDDDGSLWGDLDNDNDGASDLNREWQKRCDHFHTIGFRDGVIAGQQAIAQEGFNSGFKQSVLIGYNWGVVRGISSALACLPDGMKEKLIETEEMRSKFQGLHKSVHSISTTDALKLFHDDITAKNAVAEGDDVKMKKAVEENDNGNDSYKCNRLEDYTIELKSLLVKSPAVKSYLSPK